MEHRRNSSRDPVLRVLGTSDHLKFPQHGSDSGEDIPRRELKGKHPRGLTYKGGEPALSPRESTVGLPRTLF